MAPGEVHAGQHDRRAAVGGGADLEQAQRVGHHRRAEHLLDGDLLAVPGVRVGQPVAGVLDLDLREVLVGGAVEVHAAAGVEREVGRVGRAEQAEAQPVGVVRPVAAGGGEEALGRGVGADHEGDVAQAGQDPRAGGLEGGHARRAGRVARRHAGARSSRAPGRRWRPAT